MVASQFGLDVWTVLTVMDIDLDRRRWC